MKSVSNLLVQEFMLDVQRLCASAKVDSDASHLRDYLLTGRGCLILHVLHTIGVQVLLHVCKNESGAVEYLA